MLQSRRVRRPLCGAALVCACLVAGAAGEAVAQGSPDISVTPDSLFADLLSGQVETQVLTIANGGGGDLDWQGKPHDCKKHGIREMLKR